uniref:Hexosyltransferase n=1 Tax=Lepeophtheirus salmonis TaxID=72036 RepID=A0A0K2U674_LEPSM
MFRRAFLFTKAKILFFLLSLTAVLIILHVPSIKHSEKKVMVPIWPMNQSRDVDTYVKSNFLLEPDDVCSKSKELIVFITSSPRNFEKRESIRSSWAKDAPSNVGVIFVLGQYQGNQTVTLNITLESEKYKDILQGDFMDSYIYLSIKSLIILQWFVDKCPKSRYLLKTDDDVYINIKNLLDLTRTNQEKYLLIGSLICNAIPIRDPYNKYYSPRFMFSARKYPTYLSGTGYVLSSSAVEKLYNASLTTPIFHLEDVYITGILATSLSLKRVDHLGFSYVKRSLNNPCNYNSSISSHELSPQEMTSIHEKILNLTKKCLKVKKKFLRPYGHPLCSKKKFSKT